LWEKESFRFRDIHLFDEEFESSYLRKAGTGNQFFYYALPIVDGFNWSTKEDRAGLRIVKIGSGGRKVSLSLKDPTVTEKEKNVLEVSTRDEAGNIFTIIFHEDRFEVNCKPKEKGFNWILELHTAVSANLPFQSITRKQVKAEFRNFSYSLNCNKGSIQQGAETNEAVFQIMPAAHQIVLDCTNP
jgi:hypothetical protein